MKDIKNIMLDKKRWVVVGATDDKKRFGYKIWRILKKHGYEVYGVNPRLKELEGEKIYSSLKDLPVEVDVLNMVVGPKIANTVLDRAKEVGIKYIFFQPGSYNDELIEKVENMGFNYLIGDCIYATLINK